MVAQLTSNCKKILKDHNFIYFILFSFCLGAFFVNLSTFICLLIFAIQFKKIKIYINKFIVLFYFLIIFWITFCVSTIINSTSDIQLILKSFAYLRFIIFPFVIIYMMNNVEKKN